ncbi:MAG: hypothetical protein AAFX02_05730, partial [Pseudomonadota bacterium]
VFARSPEELDDMTADTAEHAATLLEIDAENKLNRAFDARFKIRRTASPNGTVIGLIFGMIAAARVLRDASPTEAATVAHGLMIMVRRHIDGPLPAPPPQQTQSSPAPRYDPLSRWQDGHTLFICLDQGLIAQLVAILEALNAGDLDSARIGLESAAAIFHATAVALLQTGAMSREEYESIVRPTMEPPNVAAGFSGTFLAEHRRLLRLVKEVNTALSNRPAELSDAYDRYVMAINASYSAHRHCCELVAGDKPSLAKARLDENGTAAADSLKKFGHRALRSAGHHIITPNQTET